MTVRIITDSTSVPAERYMKDISAVIPLIVSFGEEQYLDGIEITNEQFYNRLTDPQARPKTSQPGPGQFAEVFKKVKEAGDTAVCITVGAKLSGTYQSACIAANGDPDIQVIDSDSAAIGTGILVEYAAELVRKGLNVSEIADRLNEAKDRIIVVALIETLEYLRRGGRISGAAAIAGGLLNIKPVVNIEHGAINVIGKARGYKSGRHLLSEKIEEVGGADYDMPVMLGYTGNDSSLLYSYIEYSKDLWEGKISPLDIVSIGPVIGTHAGPGAVAAAFFRR